MWLLKRVLGHIAASVTRDRRAREGHLAFDVMKSEALLSKREKNKKN